ncbi:protein farnesyltransferase subunit beta [Chelonus insularis]|uniref:protein farnesyltransferase subunit beta n=1 Tax=Chelonus insularis TaxID=460826 RepID=UPI00158D391C|nr:protein farnesyltransferase subunit beta [Chelonus insularis]
MLEGDELDEINPEESLRTFKDLLNESQDDENVETETSAVQDDVEELVLQLYKAENEPILTRGKHVSFLKKSLAKLSVYNEGLDSSRPWLCYWALHALNILGKRLEEEDSLKVVNFLSKCQHPTGGFGGGPGQYPHLATTYAAVSALCTIGTKAAFDSINREGLVRLFKSLKLEDGSVLMHVDGELDIRGVYCAISVAKLTNTFTPELFENTGDWIAQCQTWEGGFGGCPGMEAHGGYTYCGLAALVLLGEVDKCNIPALLRWIANKQMRLEGGFQGRTNKLVDGCYSFWQGASFSLVNTILLNEKKCSFNKYWLFDQRALQEYILICCQHRQGGFLDKPKKDRDVYHTSYVLSGLSIAQNSPLPLIIGRRNSNTVESTHPLYNVVHDCVERALEYFKKLPIPD